MFKNEDLRGKSVFLRGDLNIPLNKGIIVDDTRLNALQKTIDALVKRGATVILATHIGRPQESTDTLSTKVLMPWFKHHGYHTLFLPDLNNVQTVLAQKPQIILLENLRFYKGEKSDREEDRRSFAQALAALADYYINDAFGLLHRNDTSTTLLPTLFEPHKRTLGLLVTQECAALNSFITSDTHPFLLIIGGNKLSSKLPFIKALLSRIDTIAWCPAPVFTLIKSQGGSIGRSYVEDSALTDARSLVQLAKQKGVTCLFPLDYQVTYGSFQGPFISIAAPEIPPTAKGIAIGPKTITEYTRHIHNAQRVLYNGLMGMLDYPATLNAVQQLFQAMANSSAKSIIAGGDSVAAAKRFNLKGIDYLSTGGGATLAYLSGAPLPGLRAFPSYTAGHKPRKQTPL